MRKTLLLVLMTLFTLSTVSAQFLSTVSAQFRTKIAVMDFNPGVGVDASMVNGLSDMLISSLFDTGNFTIVERNQLNQVIKEQGFQGSNLSAGQIAQVGKILGVKAVLVGTVNVTGGEYNIDVRIVDVESGEVVATAGVTKTTSKTYRDLMPPLANELAAKIAPKPAALTMQSQIRIAYINTQQIITEMPEYVRAEEEIRQYQSQLQNKLEQMQVEFNKMMEEYQRSPSTSLQQQLQNLQEQYQDFSNQAQNNIQNKQGELMAPVIKKLERTIEIVGDENSFACIIDESTNAIPYKKGLIDATVLVKRKLGIY
ncbi:MAG: OmpH family outer membrane protein [Odoribacteraceae bacterium]|nr:OmpH family outer membrane protein [Odoribacteraceae bacterium]